MYPPPLLFAQLQLTYFREHMMQGMCKTQGVWEVIAVCMPAPGFNLARHAISKSNLFKSWVLFFLGDTPEAML